MKFLFVLIGLFYLATAQGQSGLDERKERADALFDEALYLEALKMYTGILAHKPRDYELNFKYGACLVMSDEESSAEDALKYLNYAFEEPNIDQRIQFFLGYAHEKLGNCTAALEFYHGCKVNIDKKIAKKLGLKERIKHCEKNPSQ